MARHDPLREYLEQHLSDRQCSGCKTRVFVFSVTGVDVIWCPECDRPRCRHCNQAVGLPFSRPPHRCPNPSCGKVP